MLAKLIVGAAGLLGLYKAGQYVERHYAKKSVIAGHSYAVTVDYSGTPVAPMTQAAVQALIDTALPGAFDVIACSMVPNAKQVALTLVPTSGTYITGNDITQGWPTAFGTVTLDSITDMGAAGAGTAVAPLATT
jgi:hypothetical protein